jgi:hypothetical protein
MPCHLTPGSHDVSLPVGELGRLCYRGLSGPRSSRSRAESRTANRTAVNCSGVELTEARGRRETTELGGMGRLSTTRGPTPGHGTSGHGGTGEPELVEFDKLVWAVRLGDALGTEGGAWNPEYRVPGEFRVSCRAFTTLCIFSIAFTPHPGAVARSACMHAHVTVSSATLTTVDLDPEVDQTGLYGYDREVR